MKRFQSPFGEVELTNERLRHILQFHPEIRLYQKLFGQTVENPEIIRRSKFDPKVFILYLSIAKRRKYLAVVIKTNQRNFILTAYLTMKIQHEAL